MARSRDPWHAPSVVEGFLRSPPNERLMAFARSSAQTHALRILDIGCGAGRNAVPLAGMGACVLAVDRSGPMLDALVQRTAAHSFRLLPVLAEMDALPIGDARVNFLVAHGVWNLARTDAEFRRGVREAARAARPGSGLFVFTFSRNTLPADAAPVPGESLVFTQFSGEPQCFLTREQLVDELAAAGFTPHSGEPIVEHNRREPNQLMAPRGPVIYEGIFRKRG